VAYGTAITNCLWQLAKNPPRIPPCRYLVLVSVISRADGGIWQNTSLWPMAPPSQIAYSSWQKIHHAFRHGSHGAAI